MMSETFIDDFFFFIFDDSLSTQYLYYMIFRLNISISNSIKLLNDVKENHLLPFVDCNATQTFNYIFINWMLIKCICQMYVKKVTLWQNNNLSVAKKIIPNNPSIEKFVTKLVKKNWWKFHNYVYRIFDWFLSAEITVNSHINMYDDTLDMLNIKH